MAMQDNDGAQVPNRRAIDQGTPVASTPDDDARWRVTAKLVQAMRDAGYDCELRLGENLN